MRREWVVAEGPRDALALQRAGIERVVLTHGFSLPPANLKQIQKLARTRGVILMMDPDSAGEQIRAALIKQLPPVKHVWLPVALATQGENVGIEHAEPESIHLGLDNARLYRADPRPVWTDERLERLGLADDGLRYTLGERLFLGRTTLPLFRVRLNRFAVSPKELEELL